MKGKGPWQATWEHRLRPWQPRTSTGMAANEWIEVKNGGNRGRASQRGAWRARCSRRGPEASGSTTALQRPKVEEDEDGELSVQASLEELPGSVPRRRRARARRPEPLDTERRRGVTDGHAGRDDGATTVAVRCGADLGIVREGIRVSGVWGGL